jgi:cytochrome c551/c552
MTLSLDCKSCHKENEKSIGPSYLQVAQKYKNDPDAMNYLTEKIIKGGGGVWGETAMAAHPTLAEGDVRQMVSWIMSLSRNTAQKKSLPASGTITPETDQEPNTSLVLSASYTDKGGPNIKPLTGRNTLVLNSNTVSFTGSERAEGFTALEFNDNYLMIYPQAQGWFALDSIDLQGVKSIQIMSGWREVPPVGFNFEVRLDAPDGTLLGKGTMPAPQEGQQMGITPVRIEAVTDGEFHDLYFVYTPENTQEPIQAGVSGVQFNGK